MRESAYNSVLVKPALASGTYNTVTSGLDIDKHVGEQAFRSVSFAVHVGAITDGTHTFSIEDSDDGVSWNAAETRHVQNSGVSAVANSVVELGYNGYRRYARVVGTSSGTTGAAYSAVALLVGAGHEPVSR